MYSSKITTYGDKSLNRLDSKDEYVEEIISEMRANTEYGKHIFKTMLSLDEELRNDMGLSESSEDFYKEHIKKQLYKLDIICLTFLLNGIIQARGI